MQTTEEDLLFRAHQDLEKSDARKAKLARIADKGDPIQLSTKALALIVRGDEAFTAESGHVARRIDLNTGKTRALFKGGHTAPVTCLQLFSISRRDILVTGSWDKSIRFWDAQTKDVLAVISDAHSDFVKSLLFIQSLRLLVSGGSDKHVKVWDMAEFIQKLANDIGPIEPPRHLHTLKQHTRPIECLAMHSIGGHEIACWSGDSMGRVVIWELHRFGDSNPVAQFMRCEWLNAHATAVYQIVPDTLERQVWTASGDCSLLLSSFDPRKPSEAPKPLRRIEHSYFVKCVLPTTLCAGQIDRDDIVLTGSTDETIRVFDASVLSEPSPPTLKPIEAMPTGWKPSVKANAKPVRAEGLLQEIEAHAHEVNALALWQRADGPWIVSSSLDSTLRRWSLTDLIVPPVPKVADRIELLSAEEEAELAELMED